MSHVKLPKCRTLGHCHRHTEYTAGCKACLYWHKRAADGAVTNYINADESEISHYSVLRARQVIISVKVETRDIVWLRKQDAQLSQRDRAAGCVTVFAKSRTLELGDDILRTL